MRWLAAGSTGAAGAALMLHLAAFALLRVPERSVRARMVPGLSRLETHG